MAKFRLSIEAMVALLAATWCALLLTPWRLADIRIIVCMIIDHRSRESFPFPFL